MANMPLGVNILNQVRMRSSRSNAQLSCRPSWQRICHLWEEVRSREEAQYALQSLWSIAALYARWECHQ